MLPPATLASNRTHCHRLTRMDQPDGPLNKSCEPITANHKSKFGSRCRRHRRRRRRDAKKSTNESSVKLSAPTSGHQLVISHGGSSRLIRVAPTLIALIVGAALARAQCPEKTMTSFERIGGVTIKDTPLNLLFSAPNSSFHHQTAQGRQLEVGKALGALGGVYPITAECNNRCRRNSRCRAFLVDYGRHTCWSVEQTTGAQAASGGLIRAPTPIHLAQTSERTAYFEKVCLNLAPDSCERAWIFERSIGHQLYGLDDKIIDDVPSRLRCQEHCLHERDFKCRSGEYDSISMQCRLSTSDRHLRASAFRPAAANVDYFENQCAQPGHQCDSFERFDDLDLGRPEIMRLTNSSDQCQHYCSHTIKAFVCRSFTWSAQTGKCYLNSVNTQLVGGLDKLQPAPGLVYFQRTDCTDLRLECDTGSMTLNLRTNEPFRGRMYVRDEPAACETLGRSALISSLQIPFQQARARCATRELPSRYSSIVVVQQHPLIQRKSDRYIKLVCDFQTANRTITSAYNVAAQPWSSTALINATSLAPKIRLRITDKFANDITGAKLGDELQLRIEAESESVYDMVARSVVAKSGTSDESIVLIDRDGCPADHRIFPPLRKLNKRVIIGRFDAFKFSSDVVVRFQVDVQFCLNSCPATSCDQQQQPSPGSMDVPSGYSADSYSAEPTLGAGPDSAAGPTSTLRPPEPTEPKERPDAAAPATAAPEDLVQTASEQPSGQLDQFLVPLGPKRQRQPQLVDQGRQAGAETAAAGQRQPSARSRRRRRSAEPMPEGPRHVPLQREIIVIESADEARRASASSSSDNNNNNNNSNNHTDIRTTERRPEAKPRVHKSEVAADPLGAKHRRQRLLGPKLKHQYRLLEDEDPLAESTLGDESRLLCTTWGSLVWASLAFCALQLLTCGLCLAAWMRRQRQTVLPAKPSRPQPSIGPLQLAHHNHVITRGQFGIGR